MLEVFLSRTPSIKSWTFKRDKKQYFVKKTASNILIIA